jgi:antitoxin ParD1/3/4
MATNVHLTPELERFARECVEGGRYNNVSEVVRSALRLLLEAEERRHRFVAMLSEAERESDESGAHGVESVLKDADHIIEDAENARRR